jgi:membrane associated rhomboid family serine protease
MFPNSNFQNNQNQNQNSNNNYLQTCRDTIKQYWSGIPFFARFIIIITITSYFLSWFTNFMLNFTNIPLYTIYKFQLWRLMSSVFMTLSIINILFAFIAWLPDALKLEKSTGTVRYFFNFMINSILIQIMYTTMILIISLFLNQILLMPSSGLWPMILAEITMLCLSNPNGQLQMMFIPCMIPSKFYPWALFGFFTLLNMNLQFDILAGILYGYLFFYFLKNKLQFSDEFISRAENWPILNIISKFESFVSLSKSISNNGGNLFFTGSNSGNANAASGNIFSNRFNNNNSSQINSNNQPQPNRPQPPVTTPFKGKGSVLGCK